ncbi:hypothetical protein AMIS_20680 [Actinoplanes missouriensis 431]|uniref:Uncharacterized protein n=1 Tax=Actinoplanes missouriensis (strain ATCC 14538 / DSM 43046 / CBS 188.64 / JCM 3121 / NBRC 102363 / NCIMB 12654 / NRRL B-3342 / UNCC 431) TaxID=512565 RepID=I0H2Q1_ACTM4|nr:hypothetical protein [Actinoplanes missouriensis]BAL87288.1 hypothetical protein AMIS_20680 [Actinoplanes missouriensis 431]
MSSGGDFIGIGPRPLPTDTAFYPCVICGTAIPDKGRSIHDQWHADTADAVIDTARRVERMEAA